jgi:hypothetical protein
MRYDTSPQNGCCRATCGWCGRAVGDQQIRKCRAQACWQRLNRGRSSITIRVSSRQGPSGFRRRSRCEAREANGAARTPAGRLNFGVDDGPLDSPRLGRPDAFPDTGRSLLPESDRFMTADPLGGDVGNLRFQESGGLNRSPDTGPQSLNRYGYVANNPASFSDPRGLASIFGGADTTCGGLSARSSRPRQFLVPNTGRSPSGRGQVPEGAGARAPRPPGRASKIPESARRAPGGFSP